jgi:hypothetical protein
MRTEVKDDNGKWFPIFYPVMDDDIDHAHIIHRFIAKVLEKEWSKTEKGKSTYKNIDKFPTLVDKVEHGCWEVGDKRRQFNPGFKGKRVTIMNVIDRSDMEWHREHLKMKLLSKGITFGKNGEQYIDVGVPSYGFIKSFEDMLMTYGNWSKYDIAIKRTGDKQTPYVVKNASRLKAKDMMEELKCPDTPDADIISVNEGLTQEELSWEFVDLRKEFAPTSYFMLKKRLGRLFAECDVCLGTRFVDELNAEIDKEKAESAAEQAENETVVESKPIAETPVPRVAKREAISEPAKNGLSAKQTAVLKGYPKLTDQEKNWILDVVLNDDGTLNKAVYDEVSAGGLVECPSCNEASPTSFKHCPVCGVQFADD